jgi:hypothetical protein
MMRRQWQSALLPVVLACAAATAQGADVLPQCRGGAIPQVGPPDTALFVAVDSTTPLDADLRQQVQDYIKPFLVAGNAIALMSFPSAEKTPQPELALSGRLDTPLEAAERGAISKSLLARFDQCLLTQKQMARQYTAQALRRLFNTGAGTTGQTEVMGSMQALSQAVQASGARNKVVLVVSDMLEHSAVADFYADHRRTVRRVDPQQELRAADSHRQFGDFGGARVYVMAAGVLADGGKLKPESDRRAMQLLQEFWSGYFGKSHAQLAGFGQLELEQPMR